MNSIQRMVEKFESQYHTLISKEWRVGALDRGMGHYSYGVITIDGELIVKCDHEIIAQHIVKCHNLAGEKNV